MESSIPIVAVTGFVAVYIFMPLQQEPDARNAPHLILFHDRGDVMALAPSRDHG